MAQQWERICDLPEEVTKEVRSFYSGRFPLEIRARFSKWIDEKPWYFIFIFFELINSNNTSLNKYAPKIIIVVLWYALSAMSSSVDVCF